MLPDEIRTEARPALPNIMPPCRNGSRRTKEFGGIGLARLVDQPDAIWSRPRPDPVLKHDPETQMLNAACLVLICPARQEAVMRQDAAAFSPLTNPHTIPDGQ